MDTVNSALGKLTSNDVVKGAITAAAGAIVTVLYKMVTADGFDAFSVDWIETGKLCFNVAIASFTGDLFRRLFTDQEGKLFGKIG